MAEGGVTAEPVRSAPAFGKDGTAASLPGKALMIFGRSPGECHFGCSSSVPANGSSET